MDTATVKLTRPLRILDHAWHQAHSYRLHALPAEFWYARTYYHSKKKVYWDYAQRPAPPNWRGPVDEADLAARPPKFDLCLSHLDQWCDSIPHRALPFRRMRLYAKEVGIPFVAIMHGTPDNPSNRRAMLRLMGDTTIVTNSRQAAEEWDGGEGRRDAYGRPQFTPIIHGYDVDEFGNEPLDVRRVEAATICSGGELSRGYHGIPLLERLAGDRVLEGLGGMVWYGPAGNRDWFPDYGSYCAALASTLIYFSPTRRAPMPGARTEAMLSGCCVVTVPGQDAETYIESGRTGFVVNTYIEARDTLADLLAHPDRAWRVGQAGRKAARVLFDKTRYIDDWMWLLLFELGIANRAGGLGVTDLPYYSKADYVLGAEKIY